MRRQAFERGWLDPKTLLPEDRALAEVFTPAPTNRSVSSAAPFQEQILAWHGQGITATAIQQALARKYRFTGSVHTIYSFVTIYGLNAGSVAKSRVACRRWSI